MSVWSDIAETVGEAAPVVGSLLGGPAGGAVGRMVAGVLGVDAQPDSVASALRDDPEALVKLKRLEAEHARELRRMHLEAETARLGEVNATMRAEAAAQDPYVRRWRPTFGYLCSATWAVQAGGLVYAIVATPQYAAELIEAVTALTPMWGIALAVLGINVHKRSQDKQVAAGQAPGSMSRGGGLLGALAGRIQGKGAS